MGKESKIDSVNTEHSVTVIIPVSVLSNRSLSLLESVIEYLKDSQGMNYHEIAVLLNRDDRTIWTCYNRACKKRGDEK